MSNSARRKVIEMHAEIESLRQQLTDAEESNKAVERALKDVDYRGSYADGVLYLRQQLAKMTEYADKRNSQALDLEQQLAKTQDEFYFQACLTKDLLPYQERAIKSEQQLAAALAACEAKDKALIYTLAHLSAATSAYEKFVGRHGTRGRSDALFSTRYADFISAEKRGREALTIKPDTSALRQRDEALIEKCAEVCEKSDRYRGDYFAEKIRELKEKL